ncbi:MAG: hypothetical protein L0216_09010 [Planctomycetales bacterium]|nr:hypothetical protein [Planctomycetales bacterium]
MDPETPEAPRGKLRRFAGWFHARRARLLLGAGAALALLGFALPVHGYKIGTEHAWEWTYIKMEPRFLLLGCAAQVWGAVLAPMVATGLAMARLRSAARMAAALGVAVAACLACTHGLIPFAGRGPSIGIGTGLLMAGNAGVLGGTCLRPVGVEAPPSPARAAAGTALLLALAASLAVVEQDPVARGLRAVARGSAGLRPPGWSGLAQASLWLTRHLRPGVGLLKDIPEHGVRAAVIEELACHGDPAAGESLLAWLDTDGFLGMGTQALLARGIDSSGISLEDLLRDPRERVAPFGLERALDLPDNPEARLRKRTLVSIALARPDPALGQRLRFEIQRHRESLFPGDLEGWMATLVALDERVPVRATGSAWSEPAAVLLDHLADPRNLVRRIAWESLREKLVGGPAGDPPPPPFAPDAPESERGDALVAIREWVAVMTSRHPRLTERGGRFVKRW